MLVSITRNDPAVQFKLGFHAIPSMRQVHMHVISTDMDSDHLKNKKHWNSFTTSSFLDAQQVRDMLATQGTVQFNKTDYEALLKRPLRCHRCGAEISTIPALKSHIQTCSG